MIIENNLTNSNNNFASPGQIVRRRRCSDRNAINLFPNSNVKPVPVVCHGHTRPVVNLAFSRLLTNEKIDQNQQNYFLVSACKDGKPMLRLGTTGDWIGTFEGHKGAVWGVDLTDNGRLASTGAADFEAKVWSTKTGDLLCSFQCNHIVRSVNFSQDNNQILIAGNSKLAKIYDLNKCTNQPSLFTRHTASIRHALFLANGKRIVTVSEDKTLRFWHVSTKGEINRFPLDHVPISIELSVDKSMLTICYGNKVSFWDSDHMIMIKEFTLPTQILTASLHPQMDVFVCGGNDFKMYKCDYSNGSEIESFKGHFGPVHSVRFSPDGELYASGSEDGTIRLWQTNVGKNYGLWRLAPIQDFQLAQTDDGCMSKT